MGTFGKKLFWKDIEYLSSHFIHTEKMVHDFSISTEIDNRLIIEPFELTQLTRIFNGNLFAVIFCSNPENAFFWCYLGQIYLYLVQI